MSVIPSLKKLTHDDYPASSRQKQYSCYTRSIDAETLLAFRYSIRLAPVFIQKRIQKKAEYRLILISKHDFVCRIDAKHINDAEVTLDWRVTEPDKLVHVPDKLPIDYLNKLYQMLDELGLNFGAFDIIRDEDDTLYFIELNPNGQWYWIEIITKMPMVRAIVELIEDLALQYQQDCGIVYRFVMSTSVRGSFMKTEVLTTNQLYYSRSRGHNLIRHVRSPDIYPNPI